MASLLVKDVVKVVPLITIQDSGSLVDVLKILQLHKISAVPVLSSAGKVVSFVGWSDVLRFFVEQIHGAKQSAGTASHAVSKADLERLATTEHGLGALLKFCSNGKKLRSVSLDSPLDRALALLGSGQHRVPVKNADGKLVAVLSQRDLLEHFAKHTQLLGALGAATVAGLGLGSANVLTVRETDIALDSFYAIARAGYQGAAVVDPDGRLVNNLSIADVGLCDGDLTLLQKHVRAFVLWQPCVRLAEADSTIAEIVQRMSANRVRRLFIINNEAQRHVVGVVTATDVLHQIWRVHNDEARDKKKDKKKEADGKKAGKEKDDGKKQKKKKSKYVGHLEKQSNKKGGKK